MCGLLHTANCSIMCIRPPPRGYRKRHILFEEQDPFGELQRCEHSIRPRFSAQSEIMHVFAVEFVKAFTLRRVDAGVCQETICGLPVFMDFPVGFLSASPFGWIPIRDYRINPRTTRHLIFLKFY